MVKINLWLYDVWEKQKYIKYFKLNFNFKKHVASHELS
jgi:hypothetical protein